MKMRFHTFFTALTAASIAAGASIGTVRQRRETALGFVGLQDEAPPVLEARSPGSRPSTLSNLRFGVRIERNSPSIALRKRDDDDDDDDDGDDDDDDDDDKRHHRTNSGAIAGGVIGGIIVLLVVLFLLFWYKCRSRRQKRRQQKQRKNEDEERRRKEEEEEQGRKRRAEEQAVAQAMHTYPTATTTPTTHQDYYGPIPLTDHEANQHQPPPPNYQQVFPSAASIPASRAAAVAGPSGTSASASASTSTSPPPPLSPSMMSQRRGTMEFPAELPSPIDGREPSSLPSALEPSDAKVDPIPPPAPAPARPTYY